MSSAALPFGLKTETLQQGIKWIVYLLLAINFVPYLREDWHAMLNGMPVDSTWLDWTGNFATSMDVVAPRPSTARASARSALPADRAASSRRASAATPCRRRMSSTRF